MKIAYYAPMKPPTDSMPSGDREIARLFKRVLVEAGHDVHLASRFRAWEGKGDSCRQQRLCRIGTRLADRLLRRYRMEPPTHRPAMWFTYHLYHKAPDWLGPRVSQRLGIPYVVAEACYAPKQSGGPWRIGHDAVGHAIAHADAVLALNSKDIGCVRPLLKDPKQLVHLGPFVDTSRYAVNGDRGECRRALAQRFDLDSEVPWLLAVAMMREGDKLASYQMLGVALRELADRPWRLLIVGDGDARLAVETAFRESGDRVVFAGLQSPESLLPFYAAADIFVWPAVNEAFGMALLESQAAGMAAVVGHTVGVADIVRHDQSGVIVPPSDVRAFASALGSLLQDPARIRQMGLAARDLAARAHGLTSATETINRVIQRLCRP